MADVFKLGSEWEEWVNTRPAVVKDLCLRYPPNKLYRIKTTGQRVTIHSYAEDGTVTVDVTGEFNRVIIDTQVFGVAATHLVECDVPGPNEPLGTVLTTEAERDVYINLMRELIQSKKPRKLQ